MFYKISENFKEKLIKIIKVNKEFSAHKEKLHILSQREYIFLCKERKV